MSARGLEVIDHTVKRTHVWINELAERLDWSDRGHALLLLRAVLTTLRDMLSHDEAAHLAAQLPLLIRGMFYEGWRPSTTPIEDRSKAHFVAAIDARMRGSTSYDGEADIEEVFRLLNRRISDGEIADVRGALPQKLRDLWPA